MSIAEGNWGKFLLYEPASLQGAKLSWVDACGWRNPAHFIVPLAVRMRFSMCQFRSLHLAHSQTILQDIDLSVESVTHFWMINIPFLIRFLPLIKLSNRWFSISFFLHLKWVNSQPTGRSVTRCKAGMEDQNSVTDKVPYQSYFYYLVEKNEHWFY